MLLEIYVVPPIYPVAENNEAGIPLLAGVAIPSGSVVYFTSTGTYTFGDNVVVGLGPEINFNEAPEINFDDNAKAGNKPFSLDSLAGEDCMLKVKAEDGCGLLLVEVP